MNPTLFDTIRTAATQWSVPVWLAFAIAEHESGFQVNAVNDGPGDQRRGGSHGIFQMSFQTAKDLGFTGTVEQLRDPPTNAALACRLIHTLLNRKDYTTADAICAYNSGRRLANAPTSTRTVYLPAVLSNATKWKRLL